MISQIPQSERGRFEQFIRRFRDRWRTEFSGPLTANQFESCLPVKGDPLRRAVLLEIVAIDLVTRLERGQRVSLLGYLNLFSELGPAEQLPVAMLQVEYDHRQRSSEPISAEAYASLFPAQAAQFLELIGKMRQPVRGGTMVWDASEPSAPIQAISHRPQRVTGHTTPFEDSAADEEENRSSGDPYGTVTTPSGRVIVLENGYRLVRKIGQGNFGEVWLSEAPGGVEVALKIVRIPRGQETKHLELRSLDLMKRLRHPFLMQVQAFWVSKEQILIAMELGDHSLRDRARICGAEGMPLAELLRYMREAAEGIDYLHREHVVHRDIKPENLLLLKGHIKVADFGLARFMDESGLAVAATQVAGSPLYMAPEVWQGKPLPSSDQYSLAIMYAELRQGRAPFSTTSMAAVMQEHLYGRPELGGMPESEQNIVRVAMSKHPGDRYGSCSEMVQALVDATSRTAGPVAPLKQPARKSVGWMVAAALGLLGLAAIIAYAIYDPQTVDPGPKAFAVKLDGEVACAYGRDGSLAIVPSDLSVAIDKVVSNDLPRGVSLGFNPSGNLLTLSADLNAPLGAKDVELTISTSQGEIKRTLRIDVEESKDLFLPSGTIPSASDSRRVDLEGRVLYERIAFKLPSGERIEFLLIPRKNTVDPPTFYIMKQEVSNRWFAQFAAANPEKVRRDAPWKKGAAAGGEFLGIDGKFQDFPVVFVNVEEAVAFAAWIGGLLPTDKQWDKAAGANEQPRLAGPFRESGEKVCVKRLLEGPLPCASSPEDVSLLGVHDLAGGVTELTRGILNSAMFAPLPAARLGTEKVILRGHSYHDDDPWKFDQLDENFLPSQPYDESAPHVGFRVVLEF